MITSRLIFRKVRRKEVIWWICHGIQSAGNAQFLGAYSLDLSHGL
jgi:hypothetical protein